MQAWNLYGYYGMFLVGTILMFTVSLCTYKKYGLKKSQALIFTLIAMLGGLIGTVIMGKIYTAVRATVEATGGSNMAIYGAVVFTPVLLIVAALISSQPWRKIVDMIAPSGMIFTACAKLGCMFLGCCTGIECSFGIYNFRQDAVTFPSPIFEFITLLVIIFISLGYAFKSKKYIPGTVYPVAAVLYASTRFLWEFLRNYSSEAERHIILGLTFWQFLSILTIIFSVIWFIGLKNDWSGKIKETAEIKRLEHEEAEKKARAEKKKSKSKNKKKRR